jgi:hypothetical protein
MPPTLRFTAGRPVLPRILGSSWLLAGRCLRWPRAARGRSPTPPHRRESAPEGGVATAVRLVRGRDGPLGSTPAGARQGRAHHARVEPAICDGDRAGRSLQSELRLGPVNAARWRPGSRDPRGAVGRPDALPPGSGSQFRRLWSAAAFVPVQAGRQTALAGTELARASVGTNRRKLFQGAARGGCGRVGRCSSWRAAPRIQRAFGRCSSGCGEGRRVRRRSRVEGVENRC